MITRAIDLIAELQKHDPVAPVEVWLGDVDGFGYAKYKGYAVLQVTRPWLKAVNDTCAQAEKNEPLPVAVFIQEVD